MYNVTFTNGDGLESRVHGILLSSDCDTPPVETANSSLKGTI